MLQHTILEIGRQHAKEKAEWLEEAKKVQQAFTDEGYRVHLGVATDPHTILVSAYLSSWGAAPDSEAAEGDDK